jgi:lysophospholipase L1-like esterase
MERQIITVDIAPGNNQIQRLKSSQGDIGRPLGVYITQNGVALDCSAYTADLYILKPDGNYFTATATVDATEHNLITWETAKQETPVAGDCAAQIRILSNGDDVGTARFVEYVEASPGFVGESSESVVESLMEYVRQAATSAETASGAASSASGSASAASGSASSAASSASAAAGSASTAHTDAETASQAAQTAQDVADSIPEDYSTLSEDVTGLKSAFDDINIDISWIDGKYINANGEERTNAAFECTDFIKINDVFFEIYYELCLNSESNIVSLYDGDKLYIAGSGVRGAGNNTPKSGVVAYPTEINTQHIPQYIRFSHCKYSAGITNPDPIIRLSNIADCVLTNGVITTPKIANQSVTKDKCSFIVHDPTTNHINKLNFSNGYINGSGAFVTNNGWRATDYCELLPNTQYYASGLHNGYCAFYRADKTVIQSYGANSFQVSSFVTPTETAYARFSLNATSQSVNNAWINTKNEKPDDYGYIFDGVGVYSNVDNPCDYDGREISVFNKILCVGDSMTEGTFNHLDSGVTQWVSYAKYSYPTYLHKMTGVDVTNLGHGGQTSVQWYSTEQNTDLSGYDCAIIQLGINDFGTYGELGADTKTAFQNIITKLKTENKNIKIFVANIIPATSYSSDGYKAFSTALLEWLETTYVSDPNVIPVDIQQYGHTGNSSAFNAGHLTALGYMMLAQDYIGFISAYIKNNGSVFREVQFIGTDYWYVNPNN